MKMRRFNFNYKTFIFGFLALPLVFLFVTACLELKSVDAPDSARAGSTQTVTLNVLLDTENNNQNYKRLVIGICAPKEWKVAENAVLTFDSPLNTEPRVGNGTMILDDGTQDKGYKKGRDTFISRCFWVFVLLDNCVSPLFKQITYRPFAVCGLKNSLYSFGYVRFDRQYGTLWCSKEIFTNFATVALPLIYLRHCLICLHAGLCAPKSGAA